MIHLRIIVVQCRRGIRIDERPERGDEAWDGLGLIWVLRGLLRVVGVDSDICTVRFLQIKKEVRDEDSCEAVWEAW